MAEWTVTPAYRNSPAGQQFASLARVFELEGEVITDSSLCRVLRVRIADVDYFVKCYNAPAQGLARFFGVSKARREWSNLQHFASWKMSPAPLVAFGEEDGCRRRGVVITEGVPDAVDLATLANQQSPLLKDRRWVRAVSIQIARFTRAMHDRHFAHNDWKWRNILVRNVGADGGVVPEVHVIDCPAGTIWYGPLFEYRRVKDLACLDKVAKYQLTRTQRLYFYKQYTGRNKLTAGDKQTLRKILAFFDGRE